MPTVCTPQETACRPSGPDECSDLSFLICESFAEYREQSADYLTSHQLADFRKCPLLFQRKQLGLIPDGELSAFRVGRAAHTLILEGRERFDEEFAVGGPINPRTGAPFGSNTKAWQEWAEVQDKDVLTFDQAELVDELAASVQHHGAARELLSDGIAEGVVRTNYCDVSCQGRLDWLNPFVGIVDLKTCDDLTWFEADARRFGYVHQLAFYRALVAQHIELRLPAFIVAVEKKEPFRCGVWQVAISALDQAQAENEAAIARLRDCRELGVWPTQFESVRLLDVA